MNSYISRILEQGIKLIEIYNKKFEKIPLCSQIQIFNSQVRKQLNDTQTIWIIRIAALNAHILNLYYQNDYLSNRIQWQKLTRDPTTLWKHTTYCNNINNFKVGIVLQRSHQASYSKQLPKLRK